MDTRLKKYIETLSEEERKLYKPLIDDALRRDEALTATFAEAKAQAALYDLQLERLRETTARFHAGLAQLNGRLAELADLSGQVARKQAAPDGGRYPRLVH